MIPKGNPLIKKQIKLNGAGIYGKNIKGIQEIPIKIKIDRQRPSLPNSETNLIPYILLKAYPNT